MANWYVFVIMVASFVLFRVQITLFWWRYLHYVVKKALLVTYFKIVYYSQTCV